MIPFLTVYIYATLSEYKDPVEKEIKLRKLQVQASLYGLLCRSHSLRLLLNKRRTSKCVCFEMRLCITLNDSLDLLNTRAAIDLK